jgi:hypothetical protein
MYNVTLTFLEDFVMFDVLVRGFRSEAVAKKFADGNARLILSPTGLKLVADGIQSSIDRDLVEIKLDAKWSDRVPLDPSLPENMVKIHQALLDMEKGIENPLNSTEDDFELVNWSYEEAFEKLECTKGNLAITECLAYGISPGVGNGVDWIAFEWMGIN